MKRVAFCLIVVTVWLIHLTSSSVFSATERRIALVIGNGAYKSAPLRNPVNDAGDIADALGKLGFSVMLKINADQRTMEESIRYFGKQLQSGGAGLFFFAGHGLQVKGRNYLIPIGAKIETESDVKYESVDAGRVLGKMEDAGNNLNIIILDACRNNPFARSFRASDRGLAKMDAPTGSILAYATAPGSVASDGPGRNGLYTSALLKHMMTSDVKIEDLFKQVRIKVVTASNKKQVPWESSSLTGDFYFTTKRGVAVAALPILKPQMPQQSTIDKEMLFWQSIQNSDDPDEYKAYVSEFPNGKFVSLANIKIRKLQQKKVVTSITPASKAAEIEKPIEKTVVAAIPPDVTQPQIVARDRHYEKNDNGIVKDTKTGLEWYVGPDKNTTWEAAKSWAAMLDVGGGGWRMPTLDELEGLYQPGVGTRNMTPLLRNKGWRVWSRNESTSYAWRYTFYFFNGDTTHGSIRQVEKRSARGFAVRPRR